MAFCNVFEENIEDIKAELENNKLNEKAGPDSVEQVKTVSYDRVYHEFVSRLTGTSWTYGLPGTDGTYFSNLLMYSASQHPVTGIYFCNPAAPFSRVERILFLFCTMSLLLMLSGMMEITTWSTWYKSLFIAALTIPFGMILRYIMECPCFHQDKYTEGNDITQIKKNATKNACTFNRDCCELYAEKLGEGVSLLMFLLSCGFLAYGMVIAINIGPLFYRGWLQSQFFSYFGTAPLNLIANFTYAWYFKKHKAIFEKRWGGHFPADKQPKSFSDVATLTMEKYGQPKGCYKNWKHYFELPDAEPWQDLNDSEESYLTTV